MQDLGKYFIRVIELDRVFIRSNTTGRTALLKSVEGIPAFIEADINNSPLDTNLTLGLRQ